MKKSVKYFFLAIFILAVIIRLILILVNTHYNDNHLAVSQIINQESSIPVWHDCWQCYHPKLYHLLVAGYWQIFDINQGDLQLLTAQAISFFSGIFTLAFLYLFLQRLKLPAEVKIISFALVAFNPALLAVNIQATNDSLVIFLSSACLYLLFVFVKTNRFYYFLSLIFLAVLAALTKASALVLFLIISIVLIVKLFLEEKKHWLIFYNLSLLFLFWLIYLAIVPYFGQYYQNYVNYDNAFITNIAEADPPHFLEKTYSWNSRLNRPGIAAIVDSYLSFRLFDLIKNPIISNWQEPEPYYRTSFWTLLYGRANFLHLANWPPGWQNQSSQVIWLGRLVLIIALLPLLILIYGFLFNCYRNLKALLSYNLKYLRNYQWLFAFVVVTYLAFLIFITYKYRDFGFIKTIHLYPAILCFTALFAFGLKYFYQYFNKFKYIFNFIFIVLITGYLLDFFILFLDLLKNATI